jgi:RNA polymerase sigma-70 factor (ECF subfamily)
MPKETGTTALDERVRDVLAQGDVRLAATLVLRELGSEVFCFLRASLHGTADADEAFAAAAERIWRSLSTFRWDCSLRTWFYVIARNEMARCLDRRRRQNAGRATALELEQLVAKVRTETLSALRTEKRTRLLALRDELPVADRALLILRVDRGLEWDDVARTFLANPVSCTPEQIKREAARLRKRFQLIKQRLRTRGREEGLLH